MEDNATDMWSRRWVAAIGVGFLGALALELLAYRVGIVSGVGQIPRTGQFLVGVVTTVGVAVAFIAADLRLTDRRLFDQHGGAILLRIVAGGGLFFAVNVAFLFTTPGLTTAELFGWLRWAVVVGSGAGLVVGLSRARAIQNAVEAERNAVRADMLESQRDVLTYLNSLLRHEVLNGTNVITGYAKLLEDQTTQRGRGRRHPEHQGVSDGAAGGDDDRPLRYRRGDSGATRPGAGTRRDRTRRVRRPGGSGRPDD